MLADGELVGSKLLSKASYNTDAAPQSLHKIAQNFGIINKAFERTYWVSKHFVDLTCLREMIGSTCV